MAGMSKDEVAKVLNEAYLIYRPGHNPGRSFFCLARGRARVYSLSSGRDAPAFPARVKLIKQLRIRRAAWKLGIVLEQDKKDEQELPPGW